MAFCGKCGSQLHDNATFCANCGATTVAAAPGAVATTPVVTIPAAPVRLEESKGFFGSLFDLSFTSFVTSKVIKFLYVLSIIVLAIGAVVLVVMAQDQPRPIPVVSILVAPMRSFFTCCWCGYKWKFSS